MTSPLYKACSHSHVDVVEFLLSKGANPCKILSGCSDACRVAISNLNNSINYIEECLNSFSELKRDSIIYDYLIAKFRGDQLVDQTLKKVSELINFTEVEEEDLLRELKIVKMICENPHFLDSMKTKSNISVARGSAVILRLFETFNVLDYTDLYEDLSLYYGNRNDEIVEYFLKDLLPRRSNRGNARYLVDMLKSARFDSESDSESYREYHDEDIVEFIYNHEREHIVQAITMIRKNHNDHYIESFIHAKDLVDDELVKILRLYRFERKCDCNDEDYAYEDECKNCGEYHWCCRPCSRDETYTDARDAIIEKLSVDRARLILETDNQLYRLKKLEIVNQLISKVFDVDKYFLSLAELDEVKIIKMAVLEGVFSSKNIMGLYPTAGPRVQKFLKEYFVLFDIYLLNKS